jgi:signal transduction histidine kinase
MHGELGQDAIASPAIERGAGRAMRLVFPVEAGPCRWLEARWAPRPGARATFWATLLFATLALLALVVVFVQRLVARPLLDRLDALRRTAAEVGTDRYARAEPWGDEMDAIARALDEADRGAKERLDREASHARMLDAFVADVAHDVRTPLASLALALDEIAEDAPEHAMPALRRALNDVVYLGSLTQNLGLVRQMRSGAPSEADTELALGAILARVVQRAEPFALRRGITIRTELAEVPSVRGNELACEQAITNLVENTIAHGKAGNEVRITLARGEGGIEIAIDDDGEGVSEADLARLGERSFRTDRARTRDQRGSGLGLSITRTVAERSGWALGFARSARGGLRATLRIPTSVDTSST